MIPCVLFVAAISFELDARSGVLFCVLISRASDIVHMYTADNNVCIYSNIFNIFNIHTIHSYMTIGVAIYLL